MDQILSSFSSPFSNFSLDSDEDLFSSQENPDVGDDLRSSQDSNVGDFIIESRNSNDDLNTLSSSSPSRVEGSPINKRTKRTFEEAVNPQNKKQKKSKMPLIKMIKIFLSTPSVYGTGIKWFKEGESFLINWDIFCKHYRFIGDTDATLESIKRRFGKDKGFIKSTDVILPPGYDVVCTWVEDKIHTPLEASLGDSFAARILMFPTCIVDKHTFFSIHEYIDRLQQNLAGDVTKADLFNIKQLLLIESKGSDKISLSQFFMFNSKFGPLSQIIAKVREFVNTNISNWYFGTINKEDAQNILFEYWKTFHKNCFLLRAAQPTSINSTANVHYIFAVSFLYQNNGKPCVCHQRLYRNKLYQLVQCIPLKNDQYLEKPVLKFSELFLGYGDPVTTTVPFVKEEIPVNPDTSPWQGGYMPTGNPYQM